MMESEEVQGFLNMYDAKLNEDCSIRIGGITVHPVVSYNGFHRFFKNSVDGKKVKNNRKSSKNHDKHYADMVIEPVDVQEQILRADNQLDAVQRHHLAEAVAYIMRAGLKAGQDWRKDIDKARNYLHRATTGEWQ